MEGVKITLNLTAKGHETLTPPLITQTGHRTPLKNGYSGGDPPRFYEQSSDPPSEQCHRTLAYQIQNFYK